MVGRRGAGSSGRVIAGDLVRPHVPPVRRHREPGMNKTEQWVHDTLLWPLVDRGEVAEVRYEGVRLRLGPGLFYTPDFTIVATDGRQGYVEVKGPRWWDDARVKIKAAAVIWRWSPFVAVQAEPGRVMVVEVFGCDPFFDLVV